MDDLLEDILEKEKLGKEQIQLDAENNKSKAQKDEFSAESIREDAMKRMTPRAKGKNESHNLW